MKTNIPTKTGRLGYAPQSSFWGLELGSIHTPIAHGKHYNISLLHIRQLGAGGRAFFFKQALPFIYHAGVEQSPEALARHLCLPPVWCSICASYGSEKRFRAVFLRCYAVLCRTRGYLVRSPVCPPCDSGTDPGSYATCGVHPVYRSASSRRTSRAVYARAQAGHIKVRGRE